MGAWTAADSYRFDADLEGMPDCARRLAWFDGQNLFPNFWDWTDETDGLPLYFPNF